VHGSYFRERCVGNRPLGIRSMSNRVHIVGAGVAGLHCAAVLRSNGVRVAVYEKSDAVGGRMRTDQVGGFLLDRGFHVMQSGYECAGSRVDFGSLGARPFRSGVRVIRLAGGTPEVLTYADPFRSPLAALGSLRNGNWFDLLRVGALRWRLVHQDVNASFSSGDASTHRYLRELGFSQDFLKRFFCPLLAGIFLESRLATSERMFRFVFQAMARGKMLLPRAGIKAVPERIADFVGREHIRLGVPARAIDSRRVLIGDRVEDAAQIIVAHPTVGASDSRSVWTLHFDAEHSPAPGGYLLLNGDYELGKNAIAHLAVPSDVQPCYGADGRALVTVTVVGDAAQALGLVEPGAVADRVRYELGAWFPQSVNWRILAVQNVSGALPVREAGSGLKADTPATSSEILSCGDHCLHGSVEGALRSAEAAAIECLNRLGIEPAPITHTY